MPLNFYQIAQTIPSSSKILWFKIQNQNFNLIYQGKIGVVDIYLARLFLASLGYASAFKI